MGWAAALEGADPGLRAQLYEELGIQGTYDPHARLVTVRADLRRRTVRVGGADATIGLPALRGVVCAVEPSRRVIRLAHRARSRRVDLTAHSTD